MEGCLWEHTDWTEAMKANFKGYWTDFSKALCFQAYFNGTPAVKSPQRNLSVWSQARVRTRHELPRWSIPAPLRRMHNILVGNWTVWELRNERGLWRRSHRNVQAFSNLRKSHWGIPSWGMGSFQDCWHQSWNVYERLGNQLPMLIHSSEQTGWILHILFQILLEVVPLNGPRNSQKWWHAFMNEHD